MTEALEVTGELVPAQSPARDSLEPPADRTEGVRICFELMVQQRWERGRTAGELAKAWGKPLNTVEQWSAEAHRHLKLIRQPEAILEVCLGEAKRVMDSHQAPMVKLAAIKVILDSLGKGPILRREAAPGTPERKQRIIEALLDPDDDLRAALLEAKEAVLRVLAEGT